jgi:nucleotide-binding universal stress UspA family protein
MADDRGVFTRILVPTDFSEPSREAWSTARRLASALGAEITLMHALMEGTLYSEGFVTTETVRGVLSAARDWAERTMREWAEDARREGARVQTVLRTGPAHHQIVAAATQMKADLIVLGTHGRSGLDRMLLGSVAEKVLRLAPCAVLAVRKPD